MQETLYNIVFRNVGMSVVQTVKLRECVLKGCNPALCCTFGTGL